MNSLFPRTLAAVSACLFVLGASGAWAHGDGHTMAGAHRASMPDASGLPASTTMTARDCWVRMLPAPAPSGGFLLIHNGGDQPVAIRGASSPDYGMVMLHQTTEENGLSKMSMVDEIEIPVGQDFELKPGGYHLMLEQGKAGLKVGDHVQVDFALGNGQRLTTQCELKPAKTLSY